MRRELSISEMIGADFFGEGMTGARFKQAFDGLRLDAADELLIRLNSPGGDVWDGMQIYNTIKSHPGPKIIQIDGAALSAASFIAMAGDTIRMSQAAMFMIHDPWSIAVGDSREMRKQAGILDQHKSAIVPLYVSQTGRRAETISRLMEAETWMTAEEALKEGFIDEIGTTEATAGTPESAAQFEQGFSLLQKMGAFKRAPENLLKGLEPVEQESPALSVKLLMARKRLDIELASV